MSRHVFETGQNSRPVRVTAGWDRPLQGFFMDVMALDDVDNPYIYSNLDERLSHPQSFEPFEKVLANMGIELPAQMIAEIYMDAIQDVGVKYVEHSVKDGVHTRKVMTRG
jgi:hypothetical protein